MKKLLAILLALLMVAGLMSTAVFAASEEPDGALMLNAAAEPAELVETVEEAAEPALDAAGAPPIKIQITNKDGANGTVWYKFDTDPSFTSKTKADEDGSGNISIDIPVGAKKVTLKAAPNAGFALQDCTILHDDRDIDESKAYKAGVEGDGYEYTLPNDDKLIVFKADFGEALLTWHTISWGGGNVRVENGQVIPYAIHVGEVTYTAPFTELTAKDALKKLHVTYSDGDLFVADGTEEDVSIDFRFIPDYGYQVTDVRATEDSLLDQFTPGTEISTFKFAYKPNTNVHFIVEFTKTDDIINSENSAVVQDAVIGDGENATDSGNLMMNIRDVDGEEVSAGLKDEVGDEEALYLDMELYQVVSKTGENGDWENQLTELEGDINVTLTVPEIAPYTEYSIIREHKTEEGAVVYDPINVDCDIENKTISFDTDKFSTYALVMTEIPLGEEEFQIEYDPRGDEPRVKADGEDAFNGDRFHFDKDSAVEFELMPPEDRAEETPIVEIEVLSAGDRVDSLVYRSDFEEENPDKIDIVENKFSFTPEEYAPFIVRVWWSEYDMFGPEEGEFMLETHVFGSGDVVVTPEADAERTMQLGSETKRAYALDTDVLAVFEPAEGAEVEIIALGWDAYVKEPTEAWERSLDELWNEENGRYEFLIKNMPEWESFYIEAHFIEAEPESEPEPEPTPTPAPAPKNAAPKTGDGALPLLWAVLAFGCTAGAAVFVKRKTAR